MKICDNDSCSLKEDFNEFFCDIHSFAYYSASRYILHRPIHEAYHNVVTHLRYGTDFKDYHDKIMNSFVEQVTHSIQSRFCYLSELTNEEIIPIIKGSAAIKTVDDIKELLSDWNEYLKVIGENIPLQQAIISKLPLDYPSIVFSHSNDPFQVVYAIYQHNVDLLCDKNSFPRIIV